MGSAWDSHGILFLRGTLVGSSWDLKSAGRQLDPMKFACESVGFTWELTDAWDGCMGRHHVFPVVVGENENEQTVVSQSDTVRQREI